MSSVFPQVAAGGITSLPFTRQMRFSTRINKMPDFTKYAYADLAARLGRWQVDLETIPDSDAAAVLAFVTTQLGQYGRFIFCDPVENLLRFSEDYAQSVYTYVGTKTLSAGQSDPIGGTGATLVTDTSGSANAVAQQIAVPPGSSVFTSSVWLRAASPTTTTLQCSDGSSQTNDQVVSVGTSWQRFTSTCQFASSAQPVTQWQLKLAASQALYVFGAQLMYLPGPGGYTKTLSGCGVHPKCRVDADAIQHTGGDYLASALKIPVIELL